MPACATTTRTWKLLAWRAALVAVVGVTAARAQSFSVAPVLFPATGDNGQSPQPVSVTLTAPSTIRSFAIPVPLNGFPEFFLVDNGGCVEDGTTVNAAGTVCSLVVRFHPQYAGVRTATLLITDGAGRSLAVPIAGTGYFPQISVLPAATRIVAGLGPASAGSAGDGDAAVLATLRGPRGVAADSFGNLYIADTGNNVVRMLDVFGNITTVAGGGTVAGAAADGGLATAASLNSPSWLAVDAAGNLYIAETGSHVVRRVAMSTSRTITTVAGSYVAGSSGDGYPATTATLNAPTGIAVDAAGNLYIADAGNFRIRRVDGATGYISAFAGAGTSGFQAGPTAAASAQFSTMAGLGLDTAGNLFVADAGNHAVREVAGGSVTVVAGNGVAGSSANGTVATTASLGDVEGVAVTPSGDVFFTDATAGLVRKVRSADGTLETIVGTAGKSNGFTAGVRPSNNVSLQTPLGLGFDSRFMLFVADSANNVVRAVGPTPGELNFAAQAVGNTSSPATVRVVNLGNAALPLAGVTAANSTTGANFTLNTSTADACGTTLAVAAVCSFTVAFSPQATGSVNGEFDLAYQPTSNPQISYSAPVLVSGGTLSSLALGPGSLSPVQQNEAMNAAITATGYFGTVALDTEGTLPAGISASVSGAVLTLAGMPTTAGTYSFTVFATDSLGATATQAYSLQVLAPSVALQVTEAIHVTDAAVPQLSLALRVSEVIHVTDTPNALVSLALNIHEGIQVADAADGRLPTMLAVVESIHVTDTPRESPSMLLNVSEAIRVSDAPQPTPDLLLQVMEGVHVTDSAQALLPAMLAVTEAIHVSDMAQQTPSLLLRVSEAVRVTDAPSDTISVALHVNEAIQVTDAPRELLPAVLAVVETVHVNDTPVPTLSLLLQVLEAVHVTDEAGPVKGPVPQTITAPNLSNHNYGDAPFSVTATASSGLAVGLSVSGPASLTNGTLDLTGAGVVSLTYTQAGNATYAAAPTVTRSFTVNPAQAYLTASSLIRGFEQPNPVLTYVLSGLVHGDTASSVGGSPTLTTTAVLNSAAGAYPIVIGQGTVSNSNYNFNLVPGTLTVTGMVAQTITFTAIPPVPLSVGTITLSAHSTSGLAVSYAVTGPATVNKNKLQLTGAGAVTVTASQAGNATFNAATPVARSFTVTP